MNPAIEEFSIQLEHDIDEQYQYAPGEQLRGEVVLSLHRTIDLHSIQVRVCGQSSVTWEEHTGTQQHPKRIQQISHPEQTKRRFESGEMYVELKKDVFLAPNGRTSTLGPGGKRFQFDFPLPLTIPSSFIGKFGCVTYVVIATLRQSMHSTVTNLVTSEPFVVTRRILLSDRPELLKHSESFVRRRLYSATDYRRLVCCCCCFGGGENLEIRFHVEKTGYLPGDDVIVGAAVDNRSSRAIEAFEAVLVMNSAFHAGSAVKESVQVVARERRACVFQPGTGAEVNEAIRVTVPSHVPESSLEGCAIIDVSYRLHLLVSVSEGLTFETNFPVTVVTVNDDQREKGHRRVKRSSSSSHSVWFSIPSTTTTTKTGNCTGSRYRKFSDSVVQDGAKTKSDPDWERDHVLDRFRHPMIPGETRENLIFKDDSTDDFYHAVL